MSPILSAGEAFLNVGRLYRHRCGGTRIPVTGHGSYAIGQAFPLDVAPEDCAGLDKRLAYAKIKLRLSVAVAPDLSGRRDGVTARQSRGNRVAAQKKRHGAARGIGVGAAAGAVAAAAVVPGIAAPRAHADFLDLIVDPLTSKFHPGAGAPAM